jgi:sigma-B regulation protein RsbQ
MQCAQDAIAPTAVGEWMARYVPNNIYRALKATGHCPHLTHPDETIRVIRDYLDSTAARIPSLPTVA